MKAITLFLAIVLAATPVAADTSKKDEFCEKIGALAGVIMERRQEGVSLAAVLGVIKNVDSTLQPGVRLLIIEAYDRPQFSTREYKSQAIGKFRDEAHLSCLKGMAK